LGRSRWDEPIGWVTLEFFEVTSLVAGSRSDASSRINSMIEEDSAVRSSSAMPAVPDLSTSMS
jgi:hypothetical protein